ncbi:MAG: extensin family protein, partial [Xanthobacteraceae bacterium]
QEAYASFPQSDAATAQAVPAAPSVCQVSLAKVAEFQPLPVLVGPGDCGADDAVEMNAITLPDQSKVAVTPPAIMRCPMAQQIADWVRDDVAPTLKGLPPLRGLDNLASYDCRGRNNVHAAKVSEHGRADALDVHDFKLADGRELGLTDVNIPKDWREAVRASACARFATVLGPGSDGYHEEHVHLDLEPRRNNYKICEWDVREPPPIVAQAKNPDKSPDKSPDAPDTAPASQLAQVEGVPLQGLDVPAIPQNAVPLPRPRPIAAKAAQQRTLR